VTLFEIDTKFIFSQIILNSICTISSCCAEMQKI